MVYHSHLRFPFFFPVQEAELVNVDEDSDVDIMMASSPTPPPQNPYSAYVSVEDNETHAPTTPPLMPPQHISSPEPMDYEQPHSRYVITLLTLYFSWP